MKSPCASFEKAPLKIIEPGLFESGAKKVRAQGRSWQKVIFDVNFIHKGTSENFQGKPN